MCNAKGTLVTVATYNEAENLPRLVEEIFRAAPQADVLVIDDNSPDGTGRWCDQRAVEDTRLYSIDRRAKLGLGTAIVAGMRYSIAHRYTFTLNMDADFSHHPRYIPALLAGMEPEHGPPVDVMIGSRYVPCGGVEGWSVGRHCMSRGVNLYAALDPGVETQGLQRRLPLLPDVAPGGARFPGRAFTRLFVPRGNALAFRSGWGPASRKCRSCSPTVNTAARKSTAGKRLAALWIILGLGLWRRFARLERSNTLLSK